MQKLQNLKQNTNISKQLQLTKIIEDGKKILLSKFESKEMLNKFYILREKIIKKIKRK